MSTPGLETDKDSRRIDWLGADGAPWRPFEEEGVLVQPEARPRNGLTLFAGCEERLVKHLGAACLWEDSQHGERWRLGDYSFYILEFSPAPDTQVYAQVWSEPGEDGVIFEVSSGAGNPPADDYVDSSRQERLRDHGFEIGGQAGNFQKVIVVDEVKDVRAIARESIAVLCNALDYDGTLPLRFHLYLGTRLKASHTFNDVCASDLAKLMRKWGFTAEIRKRDGQSDQIVSTIGEQPFSIIFIGEEDRPNQYGMIGIGAYFRLGEGVRDELPQAINERFGSVNAHVDEDGDLLVQTRILLHGGVTEDNLAMQFGIWRSTITEITKGLE